MEMDILLSVLDDELNEKLQSAFYLTAEGDNPMSHLFEEALSRIDQQELDSQDHPALHWFKLFAEELKAQNEKVMDDIKQEEFNRREIALLLQSY